MVMGYRTSGQTAPHTHVSADITDATAAATPLRVVLRDANGGFDASSANLTKRLTAGVVALTDGATINTDASQGNTFAVTLGGNRTMANPTNPVSGQKIVYRIRQDGSGNRTLTWGSAFRFSGSAPTLTTAANKTDYVGFVYHATDSKWDCIAERLSF